MLAAPELLTRLVFTDIREQAVAVGAGVHVLAMQVPFEPPLHADEVSCLVEECLGSPLQGQDCLTKRLQ